MSDIDDLRDLVESNQNYNVEAHVVLQTAIDNEREMRIAGDAASIAAVTTVTNSLQLTNQQLSQEVLDRSAGDLVSDNNITALTSRFISEWESINQDLTTLKVNTNNSLTLLDQRIDATNLAIGVQKTDLMEIIDDRFNYVNNKTTQLQADVDKYLVLLQDITMDSSQITMDNGEINMGAWTILSQAREWDLEIINSVKNYMHTTDEHISEELENIQNQIPNKNEVITQAIEALSDAKVIQDLDDRIGNAEVSIDGVSMSLIEYQKQQQQAMIDMSQEITNKVKAETDERVAQVESETNERVDAIRRETTIRTEQIRLLDDGLTTETTERIEGDNKAYEMIENLKASNETNLADVYEKIQVNVDNIKANADKITQLDARTTVVESDVTIAKNNAATALQQANAAVDANKATAERVDQMEASIETIQGDLNSKVDATAFNNLKAEVTTLDGKVTTNAQSISSLQGTVSSLDSTVSGHTSAISNLQITQTQQGNIITQISQDLTSLKSDVTSLDGTVSANTSAITLLQSKTSTLEQGLEAVSTSTTQLESKLNNLTVGGRNLVRNSNPNSTNADYPFFTQSLTQTLKEGEDMVVTVWGDLEPNTVMSIYNSGGWIKLSNLDMISAGKYQAKFKWSIADSSNDHIDIYAIGHASGGLTTVRQVKLERGNVPTDWTPAPEDIDATQSGNASAIAVLQAQVTSIDGRVTANSNSLTTLTSTVNNNYSEMVNNYSTKADTDTAISTAVQKVNAKIGNTQTYQIVTGRNGWGGLPNKSKGWYDVEGNFIYSIDRGLNLVTFDSNGLIDSNNKYDTYNDVGTQCDLLNSAINALPENKYFSIVGWDNIGYIGENTDSRVVALRNTINNYGASSGYLSTWRDNQIPFFVSQKRSVAVNNARCELFVSGTFNEGVSYALTLINGIPSGLGDGANVENTQQALANAITSTQAQVNVIDGKVTANSSQVTTLSTTVSNMQSSGFVNNKTVDIDLTDDRFNQDTWYPVAIPLGTGRENLRVWALLDNRSHPNWATHGGGFALDASWSVAGSGWGVVPINRVINAFTYSWANNYPCIRFDQLSPSSRECIFLRGGGKYYASIPNGSQIILPDGNGNQVDPNNTGDALYAMTYTDQYIPKDVNDKVNINTTTLQITNQTIDGVKAVSTVSVDNNGFISGYGLISQLVNGVVQSAFGVNADYFYVGTSNSNKKKPFMVLTSPQTINGVTYPAGTWIDVALIANATIGTAHIADAAITNAKIANLDASKITTGTLDANRIGVNTITAEKLTIGDTTNLWGNQSFNTSGARPQSNRSQWRTDVTNYLKGNGVQMWGRDHIAPYSTRIPLKSGDTFVIEYTGGRNAGPAKPLGVGLWIYDGNGNGGSSPYQYGAPSIIADLGAGWYRYRRTFQVWDNGSGLPAAYGCLFFQIEQSESESNPTYWTVGDVTVRKAMGGELIVNGAITADKISVGSLSAISANLGTIQVDTANIADGAITTAKIGDLQVDTLKIKDRAVTAPHFISKAGIAPITFGPFNYSPNTYPVTTFLDWGLTGLPPNQYTMVTIKGMVYVEISSDEDGFKRVSAGSRMYLQIGDTYVYDRNVTGGEQQWTSMVWGALPETGIAQTLLVKTDSNGNLKVKAVFGATTFDRYVTVKLSHTNMDMNVLELKK